MRLLFALALLVAAVSAVRITIPGGAIDPDRVLFEKFVNDYKKSYASAAETEARFAVFKENLRVIASLQPQHPHAQLGVNEFADMSQAEFRRTHLMPKGALRKQLGGTGIPPFPAPTTPARLQSRRSRQAICPTRSTGPATPRPL
jgi:cathepsin F